MAPYLASTSALTAVESLPQPSQDPGGKKKIPAPVSPSFGGSIATPGVPPEVKTPNRDDQSDLVMELKELEMDELCIQRALKALGQGNHPSFDTFRDKECYQIWKKFMSKPTSSLILSELLKKQTGVETTP